MTHKAFAAVVSILLVLAGCGGGMIPQKTIVHPDGTTETTMDIESSVELARLNLEVSRSLVETYILLSRQLREVDPEKYQRELTERLERERQDEIRYQRLLGLVNRLKEGEDNVAP